MLKIAQEEQNGDLFKLLDSIYKRSKIQPRGYTDAVIWEGGNPAGGVKPVAHAFTDMFALNGTLMALDVLGLPFLGVPMMAQFRHDTKLVSLDWFGKLEYTALKWSTAGDFLVNENGTQGRGRRQVGERAAAHRGRRVLQRAPLRHASPTCASCRACPTRRTSKKFSVDPATGNIHSEMNTPGVRMAYAVRLFLKMVHETGHIGRVATKPTQAQEDAVNAGIVRWLLQGTKFQLKRKYAVDAYEEHKENVDAIVALLPKDFKAGMENWGGEINEHISDTNFGLLLHDMIQQRGCIVYATDLDGDRLTDLMADAPDVLRAWGQIVLDHVKAGHRHEQGVEATWASP